jgi:glycosyltransferase involved in cell wall biosynthesis
MKIAHFPGTFLPNIGGVEIAVHNIALKQIEAGHDVYVFIAASNALKLQRYDKKALPYKMVALLPKTIGTIAGCLRHNIDVGNILAWQVLYQQRRCKFDIWHFMNFAEQALYAVPVLRKLGVPVVATCQGVDIQRNAEIGYGLRLHPAFDKIFSETLPQCNAVTAVSHDVAEEYKRLGIPQEKITYIPNGIDTKKFADKQNERAEFSDKYGIPDGRRILLSVGRNHPKKGFQYIPEIAQRLLRMRDDFIWVVIGNAVRSLSDEVREKKLQKRIILIDQIGADNDSTQSEFPKKDIIAAYKAADVFVFPTLLETFGIVIVEALAAGLPIVTTDAIGVRSIIKDNVTALISKTTDVDAMANNIDRILCDERLRSSLIENGIRESQRYDWGNVARAYEDVYRQVLNRR